MKDQFKITDEYSTHLPLLYVALDNTTGKVVEFGSGVFSTELLRKYCKEKKREFISYESKKDWAEKTGATFVEDWDKLNLEKPVGLLFIDHAPGERRKFDIEKYQNIADVIIAHDTQMSADYGYKMSKPLSQFQYRLDFRPPNQAHATAVSNVIDVSKWRVEI